MSKRAIASVLWFVAVWFAYEVVWSVTGVPRIVGPVAAAGVAAFVALDPARLFWPAPTPTTTHANSTAQTSRVPS